MDVRSETTGLQALFDAYGSGFDDYEAEAIAALFIYPVTIWQFGKGHVFETAEDLMENIEVLLNAFEEAGVVSSHFAMTADTVSGNAGFATLDWHQEDGEGAVVHSFTCHYLLTLKEENWCIAGIVNEMPETTETR